MTDIFGNMQMATSLKVLALITFLAVLPILVLSLTSFTRIIVVLGLLRQGMGLREAPPSPVLVALALFLTFFIMRPTFERINQEAIQPYLHHEITEKEAFDRAIKELRKFMLKQTKEKDLMTFASSAGIPRPRNPDDLPTSVVIPAFITSELKTAFQIGFMIYLPFLIIDLIVSSVLLSLGMIMLPPMLVSLPFKLLLFVLVDGWNLVITSLVKSFVP